MIFLRSSPKEVDIQVIELTETISKLQELSLEIQRTNEALKKMILKKEAHSGSRPDSS